MHNLILGVLVFTVGTPAFAMAAVLYSQTSVDGAVAVGAADSFFQPLGTSLNGTVQDIDFWVELHSGADRAMSLGVLCFDDAGYTSYNAGCSSVSIAPVTITPFVNSPSNFDFVPFSFNPSKYYGLRVAFTGSGSMFTFPGDIGGTPTCYSPGVSCDGVSYYIIRSVPADPGPATWAIPVLEDFDGTFTESLDFSLPAPLPGKGLGAYYYGYCFQELEWVDCVSEDFNGFYTQEVNPHIADVSTWVESVVALRTGSVCEIDEEGDCYMHIVMIQCDAESGFGDCTSFDDSSIVEMGYAGWHFNGSVFSYDSPPITTNFNEVIQYIPGIAVNMTATTTRVGAQFAIARPDLLNYFGYRIYSPAGVVVYDASTTPSEAKKYEIATDFAFTISGVYTGHAYFAQTSGGSVWEVDNHTLQYISVDYDVIGLNENGTFNWSNPATTSTTTLSNLDFECSGEGFAKSICNVAMGLFIPLPSTIVSVQGAWNSLLTNSPFNFFYGAYNFISLFDDVVDAPDTTLSVHVAGSDIDILSPSSAAAIGVSTDVIDIAKNLITMMIFVGFLFWVFDDAFRFFGAVTGKKP